MKLLLVHRYIRPDTPGYAQMLYIMGQRFAEQGHEVTIFSAQPDYNNAYSGAPMPRKQQVDGMTVIRARLLKESKSHPFRRAINFVIFNILLIVHALFQRNRYDLLTVTTFPPTIMGLVARFICFVRGSRYIYHCMDIYPEVAQTSGIIKRRWLLRFCKFIDKRNCQKAETVVVLSEDMLRTLQKRGIKTDNVQVINNFAIDRLDPSTQLPSEFSFDASKFYVIFAGNMGRFQNLPAIIDAAKRLGAETEQQPIDIEFLFVGAGYMMDALKKQSGNFLNDSIFFFPYYPITTILKIISKCQLGIVSLSEGVIDCAYPSKTMTYLEGGCKLLAVLESESSIGKFVADHQLGQTCSQVDPTLIADAIMKEYEIWKSVGDRSEMVRATGRQYFGQKTILEKWDRLIATLK